MCRLSDADARLKGFLETAADCIYTIEHSPTALEDLRAVGTMKSAPVQTVLVLEAVIVLLSPKHAFSGPNPSVFGASWQASHRLLLLPPPELARRLREVDVAAIPPHNVDALLRYLNHKEWPLPGAPVSQSRHLGRIAEWVGAVVSYNQVRGHVQCAVSRRFALVFTFRHVIPAVVLASPAAGGGGRLT